MTWLKALAPLVAFGLVAFLLRDFPSDQRLVGAIFAATICLWITEVLPFAITALLSTSALVILAGVDEKKAFGAFGDPIIPLFIGSFILAKAMEKSGLSDRLAWLILSKRWATKSGAALLLAMGILTCVVSLFVSNTATTAMFLPIGLSMLAAMKVGEGSRYPIGLMLMLTWGSSVAVGVPVGTPPNLIGIAMIESATGTKITFGQWMAFAMPLTVLLVIAAWIVLRLMYGRSAPATEAARPVAVERLHEMGRLTESERNAAIAFLAALTLWVLPDLSVVVLGGENPVAQWLQARVPASTAAIVGAALLFVLPCREAAEKMGWRDAARIDWGTILLFGGGIALGQAMFSSGLAKELGELAAQASGANTLWTITALCTATAILLSEMASNTASATTLVPVAIGLAEGAGVSPIAPALGVALGASLGFMLPVSTAPNAIVYSSGLVPSREMMKAGLTLDVLGFFLTLLCLWAILPLMGLV